MKSKISKKSKVKNVKKNTVTKKLPKKQLKKLKQIDKEIESLEDVISIDNISPITPLTISELADDEVDVPASLKEPKKKKNKEFYVEPKKFQQQILEYYDSGEVSYDLGQSIYNIAHRMSFRPNFINYTYKEEMTGDAVIKMFTALKNKKFDPKKGNPFSYYSKIAFNAFRNRIKKEKKAREALLEYQNDVYDNLIEAGHISSNNNEVNHDADNSEQDF